MQPIYLPFTCISSQIAEHVHALLGPFTVYHVGEGPMPSQLTDLEAKGMINLRSSSAVVDSTLLASLIRDYHAWADLQGGGAKIDTKAFLTASDPIPFFDDHSTARIRSEINQLRRGEMLQPKQNPMLTACLFLALAQEYDIRKMDLIDDLSAVAVMEKDMLSKLTGDSETELDSLESIPNQAEDMGGYMPKQRLEAWSTLFRGDDESADIFVTDSRSIMEQISEISDDLILFTSFSGSGMAQSPADSSTTSVQLIQTEFKQLGQSPEPLVLKEKWIQKMAPTDQSHKKSGRWDIYIVPGISPAMFWQRYGESTAGKKNDADKSSEMLNTLIFYFEPQQVLHP